MISLPLLLTYEQPCSYLDEQEQAHCVHPDFTLRRDIYAQLLAQGFWRSGSQVYRPHCPSCTACVAVRLPVAAFAPDRSQKRVLTKNAATRVALKGPVFDRRHYELYRRYQSARHPGGGMDGLNPGKYLQFLRSGWCKTYFAEFSIGGELAAVAVVDHAGNALSSVYTFFDPRFADYSLGVYAILWQLRHAREGGLEFLYLGYWIERCRKMSYKSRYRPIQALIGGEWRQYAQGQPIL